ncbi:MAG: hypothetical protein LBB21_00195 [Holosporaceae bacterium]|nr:hypothetical protein [Holosporaceae bacterium]
MIKKIVGCVCLVGCFFSYSMEADVQKWKFIDEALLERFDYKGDYKHPHRRFCLTKISQCYPIFDDLERKAEGRSVLTGNYLKEIVILLNNRLRYLEYKHILADDVLEGYRRNISGVEELDIDTATAMLFMLGFCRVNGY